MKNVLIVQRILPHYRVAFFKNLKVELFKKGIILHLQYGQGNKKDKTKKDQVELSWAKIIPDIYLPFGAIFQRLPKNLNDYDLIIVNNANKLLSNYILAYKRLLGIKVGYWGHFYDRQSWNFSLINLFKNYTNLWCDWWFAYTKEEKNTIIRQKFKSENISVVQNTIDTKNMVKQFSEISNEDQLQFRRKLGISESCRLGIFCGGIYKEKRPLFLINATKIIRKKIPEFRLLVVGAGPLEKIIKKDSEKDDAIIFLGPKFDKEKALCFTISELFLMPGLVGLAILDSFAFGVPLVTTSYPYHSPEINYLCHSENGIVTENDVNKYSNEIINVLQNPQLLKTLKYGCVVSAEKYTMETMVENFVQGIESCIALKPVR